MIAPTISIFALASLTFIFSIGASFASSGERENEKTCLYAAESAAKQTNVPIEVLYSIALTETGRSVEGQLLAWPWALNRAGEGAWFATKKDALLALEKDLQDGKTNIDIGCFQINFRWHGQNFDSLESMIDPEVNALYAANIVAEHFQESGDWTAAVGAYHSARKEAADLYLSRFVPIFNAISSKPIRTASQVATRENRGFPFFKDGLQGKGASIVPLTKSSYPIIGNP